MPGVPAFVVPQQTCGAAEALRTAAAKVDCPIAVVSADSIDTILNPGDGEPRGKLGLLGARVAVTAEPVVDSHVCG